MNLRPNQSYKCGLDEPHVHLQWLKPHFNFHYLFHCKCNANKRDIIISNFCKHKGDQSVRPMNFKLKFKIVEIGLGSQITTSQMPDQNLWYPWIFDGLLLLLLVTCLQWWSTQLLGFIAVYIAMCFFSSLFCT